MAQISLISADALVQGVLIESTFKHSEPEVMAK
jgi:hypothetical protein